jgi:cysteine desulfurase
LRDRLEKALLETEGAVLNGHVLHRLPTVTNISFGPEGVNQLPTMLGKEIALSSGSACHSANPEPSHVLRAMGRNETSAFRAVRFSLGKFNTEEEVNFVIEKVKSTLKENIRELERLKN